MLNVHTVTDTTNIVQVVDRLTWREGANKMLEDPPVSTYGFVLTVYLD
jgi:hypothetical protein